MPNLIHIEVEHGDIVYVHRKKHWHVERFDYTPKGFNKTGEFIDHDCPGDVVAMWDNDPDTYLTLEEADAKTDWPTHE